MDNEFLLQDRLQKIRQIVNKYGEENFYISFSGGKDSTVLSALVDMALPENRIPRVYVDTGIDYEMVRKFVVTMSHTDDRVVIIKPRVPIKPMLEEKGYPFKSKEHSLILETYQKSGLKTHWVKQYLQVDTERPNKKDCYACPKCLRRQFSEDYNLKVSDSCCKELKEVPLKQWQVENNRYFGMLGLMPSEGGRRINAKCLVFKGKKFMNFQPLVVVTKDWEEWFIEKYHVDICAIYYPPYNFTRTGCKGCPFAPDLQHNLDVMEEYFPTERKQCEAIWKPVYDEYRRLGYRLKK